MDTDEVADLTWMNLRVRRLTAGEYFPQQHTCATNTTKPTELRGPKTTKSQDEKFPRNTQIVLSHNVVTQENN